MKMTDYTMAAHLTAVFMFSCYMVDSSALGGALELREDGLGYYLSDGGFWFGFHKWRRKLYGQACPKYVLSTYSYPKVISHTIPYIIAT